MRAAAESLPRQEDAVHPSRSYRRRLTAAVAVSLVLHVVLLFLLAHTAQRQTTPITAYKAPLVVDLPKAPAEPPVRHLVETFETAEEPVEATLFISDRPSKAADLSDEPGDGLTPRPDVASESFAAPEAAIPAPQPPPPTPAAEPRLREAPPETAPRAAEPRTRDEREVVAQAAETSPPEPPEPAPAPAAAPEPERRPQPLLAHAGGGVELRGIGAFEAHRDELAPYLLDVRKAVERHWRAALELRYSGTTPTRAVVDCAIRPDGTLAYVTIVEPGDSVSFGGLCQGAIEKAAPFAPFPFAVPDIYRSDNLEIRWTFRFM